MGLRTLNRLPDAQRRDHIGRLLPPRFWDYLAGIDPALAGGPANPHALHIIAPPDRAELHLRAPAVRIDRDFAFSLDLENAGNGCLELAFIIINDIAQPRFNIDIDDREHLTLLGTAGRNVPEETRALAAGLGPCQVRKGLGLFSHLLPRLEELGAMFGYKAITLEPLTYHNAIMYEDHGFAYLTGQERMELIHEAFAPVGKLRPCLDGQSPFRQTSYADQIRGRSWAIHDGILAHLDGEEFLELRMIKHFGVNAGVRTFA